jgi:hypothetical protein
VAAQHDLAGHERDGGDPPLDLADRAERAVGAELGRDRADGHVGRLQLGSSVDGPGGYDQGAQGPVLGCQRPGPS